MGPQCLKITQSVAFEFLGDFQTPWIRGGKITVAKSQVFSQVRKPFHITLVWPWGHYYSSFWRWPQVEADQLWLNVPLPHCQCWTKVDFVPNLNPWFRYYLWKNLDIIEVRWSLKPMNLASKRGSRTGIIFQSASHFQSEVWLEFQVWSNCFVVDFGYFWLSLVRRLRHLICFLVFSIWSVGFETRFSPRSNEHIV